MKLINSISVRGAKNEVGNIISVEKGIIRKIVDVMLCDDPKEVDIGCKTIERINGWKKCSENVT